jgi:hypothetical protein
VRWAGRVVAPAGSEGPETCPRWMLWESTCEFRSTRPRPACPASPSVWPRPRASEPCGAPSSKGPSRERAPSSRPEGLRDPQELDLEGARARRRPRRTPSRSRAHRDPATLQSLLRATRHRGRRARGPCAFSQCPRPTTRPQGSSPNPFSGDDIRGSSTQRSHIPFASSWCSRLTHEVERCERDADGSLDHDVWRLSAVCW